MEKPQLLPSAMPVGDSPVSWIELMNCRRIFVILYNWSTSTCLLLFKQPFYFGIFWKHESASSTSLIIGRDQHQFLALFPKRQICASPCVYPLFLLFRIVRRWSLICSVIWEVLRSIACPRWILVCANSYREGRMHAGMYSTIPAQEGQTLCKFNSAYLSS